MDTEIKIGMSMMLNPEKIKNPIRFEGMCRMFGHGFREITGVDKKEKEVSFLMRGRTYWWSLDDIGIFPA